MGQYSTEENTTFIKPEDNNFQSLGKIFTQGGVGTCTVYIHETIVSFITGRIHLKTKTEPYFLYEYNII